MANPHIKTYQFRDVQLGNGDEVRLSIAITINTEGTTETIVSEDESVFISNLGEKKEDYDFEKTLLSPAFYSAVLTAIENGNFEKYFFDEDEAVFVDAEKNALVTLDIKYNGTTTWVNDFTGNIIVDSLEYDPDRAKFDFEAAPDTSILTSTMIYDQDTPLDPFNYRQISQSPFTYTNVTASLTDQTMIRGGDNRYTASYTQTVVKIKITISEAITAGALIVEIWKNGAASGNKIQLDFNSALTSEVNTSLGLVSSDYIELKITSDSAFAPTTADLSAVIRTQAPLAPGQVYKSVKTIILDCYKLINPLLVADDIEITHDWSFWGRWYDPEDPEFTFGDVFDITLDELEIDVWPLFFDSTYGVISAADVLIKLAVEFGCFTGMLNRNKAFFKKLFSLDSSDTYLLNDESYYDYKKKYKFGPLEYLNVVVREAIGVDTYNYYSASAGVYTSQRDKIKTIETVSIAAMWSNLYTATNLRCWRSVVGYETQLAHAILGASDPSFHYPSISAVYNVYPGHQDIVPTNMLLADFWFKYKSVNKHLRVDPIVAPDLDHALIKNPIFLSKTFQPISVKKKYKDCKTEIDGLIIE